MRTLPILILAATVGCGVEEPAPKETASTAAELDRDNPNPMLYRKDAHPFGRSIDRWSELLWSLHLRATLRPQPVLRPHRRRLRARAEGSGVVPAGSAGEHARDRRPSKLHHPAAQGHHAAAVVVLERVPVPRPEFPSCARAVAIRFSHRGHLAHIRRRDRVHGHPRRRGHCQPAELPLHLRGSVLTSRATRRCSSSTAA